MLNLFDTIVNMKDSHTPPKGVWASFDFRAEAFPLPARAEGGRSQLIVLTRVTRYQPVANSRRAAESPHF